MARNTGQCAASPPRFSFAWPGLAGALLIVSAVCVGCSRGAASTSNADASADAGSIFAEREQAAACPAECVETAISIARAGLGLDPEGARSNRLSKPDEIFESLRRDARPVGSTILRVPVADVMANLREGPMPPAILVNKTGHLYALFGAIRVNGGLMPQVVHGSEPPTVVSKEAILAGRFNEAWLLSKKPGLGVPIRVGSSTVEISELWHNFAETFFAEPRKCSFDIMNRGSAAIILDKPTVSCTCAVPNLRERTTVLPGSTIHLAVEQAANASSRNTLQLTLYAKGDGASRRVELVLIGNQKASMDVVPDRLDFGVVAPGKSAERSVCFIEKPTDRFVINRIDVSGLPIRQSIETARDERGLATYRVLLSLSPGEFSSGVHNGTIVVTTDSHTRPTLRIPVRFDVPALVRAIPSVIALGTINVGENRHARVEFESRDGEPVELWVLRAPDWCHAQLTPRGPSPVLDVAVAVGRAGVWTGDITLLAKSGREPEEVRISCAAYAR